MEFIQQIGQELYHVDGKQGFALRRKATVLQ
jgi:hypothetical protein